MPFRGGQDAGVEMIVIGGSIGYAAIPDDFSVEDITKPPSLMESKSPDVEAIVEAYITEQDVVQRVEIRSPTAQIYRRPPTAADRLTVDGHRIVQVLIANNVDIQSFKNIIDMAAWAAANQPLPKWTQHNIAILGRSIDNLKEGPNGT